MKDRCANCIVEIEDEGSGTEKPSAHASESAEQGKKSLCSEGAQLSVEVICERYHCVMYDYAISTVDLVAEDYEDQVEIIPVVRRGDRKNAERYLELCRINGRHLSVPTILIDGQVAFTDVPTPKELRAALDKALSSRQQCE